MLAERPIPAADDAAAASVRARLGAKAMPPGALGRVEALAGALALAQGTAAPKAAPARLLLFAGDHGLVAEGVSAWPQGVTAAMVQLFLSGGAAANAIAQCVGADIVVADAGVAGRLPDPPDLPNLRRAAIRAGTRNAAHEDAMTLGERDAALAFGAGLAEEAAAEGTVVIALGEMGIGNTASATLLAHALTGIGLDRLTGPGAGTGPGGIAAKCAVLERCAARRPGPLAPDEALAAFGGFEIAAMAGAIIGAAAVRVPVLIDGFIATAAAATALGARPEARPFCLFAHRGAEPGHGLLLDQLGAEPLLDLGLRLGEGTGALLALPLFGAAVAVLDGVASLDEAIALMPS